VTLIRQNPGGSPTKRKRKANDDEEPEGKRKRGVQSKSTDDFEKLITDAETDMKVKVRFEACRKSETGKDQ
jgi:hypothetical protein